MQLGLAADPIDLAPFERRLNGPASAPVVVAFSGGGDSLALLLTAKRWADRAGRRLIALTVDHGLQPGGAAWADWASERCRRLGVAHRTLRWDGDKPTTGLPAAARLARHGLLAEAARAAGASVILLGHTADDRMEAEIMRGFGSIVPTPREWSPSPVWPQGRGVFLLRPLLNARREALRAWLEPLGERWIEDPANDDPRFARTLARRRLTGGEAVPVSSDDGGSTECGDAKDVTFGWGGAFSLPRDAPRPARHLAALCLCASGGSRPPRGEALDRIARRMPSPGDFTASLAGARIEARGERLLVCREAGEFQRSGPAASELPAGESVFDGRFLLRTSEPGWSVRPLRGLAKHLPPAERARLALLPAAVRGSLPVAMGHGREPSCPVLAQSGPVQAFSLTQERFRGAIGAVRNEASIQRVAKPDEDA